MKYYKLLVLPLLLLVFHVNSVADTEKLAPLTVPGTTTINTLTAKMLHEKGHLFIDVRSLKHFDNGHIPGAKHLSVHSDDFTAENLNAMVKKDQIVVFYCNGITCLGSSIASKKAVEWGWKQIAYYRTGIPEWKGHGFALE